MCKMSIFNQRGEGVGGIYNTLLKTFTSYNNEEKKPNENLCNIPRSAVSKIAKTSASKAGLKIEQADNLKRTDKVRKRKNATALNQEKTADNVKKIKEGKMKTSDENDKVTKKTKGRNAVDLFSEMFEEDSK